MNLQIVVKLSHTLLTFSIVVIHVWAAFRFNRGAYSPTESAVKQIGLYLVPLVPIAVLAFSGRSHVTLFGMFYSLITLLSILMLTSQAQETWIYLLLQLPVLRICGMIAFYFLLAKKSP